MPVIQGRIGDTQPIDDPGVVDQDVEPVLSTHNLTHHFTPLRLLLDVQQKEARRAPRAIDRVYDLLSFRLQDVAYGDRSSLACEESGLCRAHPTATARDDRDLVVQPTHLQSSDCRWTKTTLSLGMPGKDCASHFDARAIA